MSSNLPPVKNVSFLSAVKSFTCALHGVCLFCLVAVWLPTVASLKWVFSCWFGLCFSLFQGVNCLFIILPTALMTHPPPPSGSFVSLCNFQVHLSCHLLTWSTLCQKHAVIYSASSYSTVIVLWTVCVGAPGPRSPYLHPWIAILAPTPGSETPHSAYELCQSATCLFAWLPADVFT